MYPTLHLLKQQRMIKPIRRGLLGGIKAKFMYPIREQQPPPPPKEKKPKKVKEEPPFMVQHTYKQAMKGLYNKAHIQFGNKVSESGNKSRRTWKPNVHYVKLYSEALDKRIEIKCTAEVLKLIDRKGGLDKYLIAMRDKDLGEKMYYLKYTIKARKDILEGRDPTDNPIKSITGGTNNKRLQEGSNRNLLLESENGGKEN
ncbi:4220_t:CDS:2 [Diversispora eburnea]|uniref:Large ribosomal subunit protein bL28m n=1 Tax=Diversispora eburnea TaxID=1213867 RepID=A0A9N8YLK3_9GLOM|nr:4220_t:CDS:2 [Diversispora eburnea]